MYVTAISPRFSLGRSTPATLAIFLSPSLFERRLCRRNPILGEASEGATEAPSEVLYPCRCLCRGFLQMIRTTPRRLTILHCSQRTLTDGRTFTDSPRFSQRRLASGCGS